MRAAGRGFERMAGESCASRAGRGCELSEGGLRSSGAGAPARAVPAMRTEPCDGIHVLFSTAMRGAACTLAHQPSRMHACGRDSALHACACTRHSLRLYFHAFCRHPEWQHAGDARCSMCTPQVARLVQGAAPPLCNLRAYVMHGLNWSPWVDSISHASWNDASRNLLALPPSLRRSGKQLPCRAGAVVHGAVLGTSKKGPPYTPTCLNSRKVTSVASSIPSQLL